MRPKPILHVNLNYYTNQMNSSFDRFRAYKANDLKSEETETYISVSDVIKLIKMETGKELSDIEIEKLIKR